MNVVVVVVDDVVVVVVVPYTHYIDHSMFTIFYERTIYTPICVYICDNYDDIEYITPNQFFFSFHSVSF